ncbi:hypothetical protein ACS127_06510 [Amphibacillus sp. Q70]|uniref:hypothetical protein n=1 Tax=Amphibacillus sp. Q70 TaxID=3453416 RepID=UPI003F856237
MKNMLSFWPACFDHTFLIEQLRGQIFTVSYTTHKFENMLDKQSINSNYRKFNLLLEGNWNVLSIYYFLIKEEKVFDGYYVIITSKFPKSNECIIEI